LANKNKDINLVAFYYMKPRHGVNTSVKGWMDNPNNLSWDERVEVTRGLKKDSIQSKVIMNLSNKTVTKNAWSDNKDFNELFKHFFKGYHQYITAVMTKLDPEYFNSMLDEMQAEIDAEKEPEASAEAVTQ